MRRFTAYYARQSSELERVALGHLVGLLAARSFGLASERFFQGAGANRG